MARPSPRPFGIVAPQELSAHPEYGHVLLRDFEMLKKVINTPRAFEAFLQQAAEGGLREQAGERGAWQVGLVSPRMGPGPVWLHRHGSRFDNGQRLSNAQAGLCECVRAHDLLMDRATLL